MMQHYLLSPISHLTSPICRSCDALRRKNGFTLIEMMTVVLLVSLLMMSIGLSARSAKRHANRTKAETECRELVNALLEYHALYDRWPGSGDVAADNTTLAPLTDSQNELNTKGITFLNATYSGNAWNDPWGNPYQIHFPGGDEKAARETALETCVSFPFRKTTR